MDYLLSLVGKDQDTITEAIKELAKNAEKVKNQEKEIGNLQNEVDEAKEEIHYLKNKLDQKYDTIEDMEHDLDEYENKSKEAQKILMIREKETNCLKKLIGEQVDEINVLRENNQSMVGQISENVIMERKIIVQNGVIKELKDELKDKNELQNQDEELLKLVEEVKHLKDTNEEKEFKLHNISKEYENLKIKLESIDRLGNEEVLTLKDELDGSKNFKCKECDKGFVSQEILTTHKRTDHSKYLQLQLRLNDVERKIYQQKLHLANKISDLRETEFSESLTCRCQGWCAINHNKHSWKVTKTEHVFKMIRSLDLNLVA